MPLHYSTEGDYCKCRPLRGTLRVTCTGEAWGRGVVGTKYPKARANSVPVTSGQGATLTKFPTQPQTGFFAFGKPYNLPLHRGQPPQKRGSKLF